MAESDNGQPRTASVEDIQKGWHELELRVGQLEAERAALEQENKSLRFMLERTIEHRQKSHSELILLLTGLVGKLPINDVGVVVSRLVEHNARVGEMCAALTKGHNEATLPQPTILKALDDTKRELHSAIVPAVDELLQLDAPFEPDMLRSLVTQPKLFFSPAMVRAKRCFVKGQVPRERVLREFGEGSLIFFNDMTTDPKLNPRPKPEEIVLSFKPDFETLLQQNPAPAGEKRQELAALQKRIQRSTSPTEEARAQKKAFHKLSFVLELLHYYENQNTEAPDVIFAQRLPVLVEQLVIAGPQDTLDEKAILEAEKLLAFIINPDHRLMVVNNTGKGGGAGKTMKHVLRLRTAKASEQTEFIAEFVRHLIPPPPEPPAPPQVTAAILKLLSPETQKAVIRGVMSYEKLRREEAEAMGKALGKLLGMAEIEQELKAQAIVPPEVERQSAWEKIRENIKRRPEPPALAAVIRDRLHAHYDGDEIKESWLALIEADPMTLIRTVCAIPYLPDGRTDSIARPVLESYVSRLMHEKYAATYNKVMNSLKNVFKAKADSPTLLNFLALVKWVDAEAANKLGMDIGMFAPAPQA
jgi:hypothetical protein